MKILIAVDDTKSTKEIFEKCTQICKCMAPEEIILLYVEKFEGRSLMTAEEVVKTAREEDVSMILIGSRGKRSKLLFMGSVSREVADTADRPVLIVK